MRNKSILFIINSNAGPDQHAITTYSTAIKEIFPTHELVVLESNKQESLLQLYESISAELVVVGGGDGTLTKVVDTLKDKKVVFAVLPLGSANGFAKCLDISTIDDALDVLSKGKPKNVDAVFINDKLSLHLADFGFNANLIQNYEADGESGMLGYFKSAAPEILNLQSNPYRLEIEGKLIEFSSKFLIIANGDKYGTGATINPDGDLGDGYVDIISLNPENLGDYLSLSISFFNGKLKMHPSVQHWRTSFCKIQNLNYSAFQIDGDSEGNPAEVVVRVIPSAFKFLMPITLNGD
jgi:diacylglycerol kinase (ATP)